jgi:hypothetical protein
VPRKGGPGQHGDRFPVENHLDGADGKVGVQGHDLLPGHQSEEKRQKNELRHALAAVAVATPDIAYTRAVQAGLT